uniref:Uncharacterized protein n=1 Tax=Pygocentrus nattereri TaxID=42514 RepID=A0A3B4BPS4_PYGNA
MYGITLAKMSMHYTRNDIQLGTTCWKYFRVCTVVIMDPEST